MPAILFAELLEREGDVAGGLGVGGPGVVHFLRRERPIGGDEAVAGHVGLVALDPERGVGPRDPAEEGAVGVETGRLRRPETRRMAEQPDARVLASDLP